MPTDPAEIGRIVRHAKIRIISLQQAYSVRSAPSAIRRWTRPNQLEHNVILVLLLAFAAAAWAVLVWQQAKWHHGYDNGLALSCGHHCSFGSEEG